MKLENKNFFGTKELVDYCLKYVTGEVADVGAGTAKYKPMILSRASSYLAFDVVPGEKIDVVGDVLNMPLSSESFDTVISTQVLEHVEKPWVMVSEIRRILKPGGVCVLTAPFLISYHPDPTDFFRYTTEGIVSLFKNEGFEIIEAGSYGRLFSTFKEIVRLGYFRQKRFKGQELFLKYAQKFTHWLDGFVKNKSIYTNIYVIARKK
ncbi:MAG: methyltransferase domain-containing protein [Patescibacteria group bacterium]